MNRRGPASNVVNQRGFTLVELLIGLVLTALVMTLIFGSLRIVSRSWDSVEYRQQQVTEQYQLQQLLRRLLAQAQAERLRDVDNVLQATFRGESEQVIFLAPLQSGNPEAGLSWYRLVLSPATAERPQALVLESRAYSQGESVDWVSLFDPVVTVLEDGTALAPPVEHVLRVTGDARLSFRYLYYEPGELAEISDQWLEQTALPLRVDLFLEEFPELMEPDQRPLPLISAWDGFSIALQEYAYAERTD